ncbi:Protein of unknown function [Chryseobacterium sp. RU37D]|uniref:DUF1648 domain-containing protein n=1 Tax=Chryseobacterium sp. RU37D TaxID=1907397 RepID=UPI000955D583|nr:DUF1648 domain-containing protein [Chryseobacterium sp. RU37D]SIP98504.1 Protein of unknown function [Chryseobacterium sp. RU37D]
MENVFLTIFDIFNFGLLIFLWWFTLKNYNALPQTIPIYFDFKGKADNFGSKKYSFLMPVILTVLYLFLVFAVRHPESVNYPIGITEKNEDSQFLIMKIFMRWLLILVMGIFLNIQDYMFRYSVDESAKPRVPLSTAILSLFASLIVVFIFVGIFK